MAKGMDVDWDTILSGKDPDIAFELFLDIFKRAKEKCIPKCSSKAGNMAKSITIYLFGEKKIMEIKHKHRCGRHNF